MPMQIFDAGLQLKSAGLVAATANGTSINVEGKARLIKAIINITAIEIASNDEVYTIVIQGSANDSTWYNLASRAVGATEVLDTDPDSAVGEEFLYFVNERRVPSTADALPVVLKHLRVRTIVAGTIATGINYTCRLTDAGLTG
jgi:hypothetical protein